MFNGDYLSINGANNVTNINSQTLSDKLKSICADGRQIFDSCGTIVKIKNLENEIKNALKQGDTKLVAELESTLNGYYGISEEVNKEIAKIYENCLNKGLLVKEENKHGNNNIYRIDSETGKPKLVGVEKIEYLEDGYIVTRYNDTDGDGNIDESSAIYYDNKNNVISTTGAEHSVEDGAEPFKLTDVGENKETFTENILRQTNYSQLGIEMGSFENTYFNEAGWEVSPEDTLTKSIGNSITVTFKDSDGDGVIGLEEREAPTNVTLREGENTIEYVDSDGDGCADSVKTIDENGEEIQMALDYDENDPDTFEALKMTNIALNGTHSGDEIAAIVDNIKANQSEQTNIPPDNKPNSENFTPGSLEDVENLTMGDILNSLANEAILDYNPDTDEYFTVATSKGHAVHFAFSDDIIPTGVSYGIGGAASVTFKDTDNDGVADTMEVYDGTEVVATKPLTEELKNPEMRESLKMTTLATDRNLPEGYDYEKLNEELIGQG
ncbi:MAG: hypothetical protein E7Z87_00815 [Cyanobacteria bacterium SIG26]|nr:hypothetical protein [Cyanobacteria bacterium SIG26]